MNSASSKRHPGFPAGDGPAGNVATAYNRAGLSYLAYADGDPESLFSFDGLHAYADRRVWSVLDAKLMDLRAKGASSVRILDAGCGPGTWLRRLVSRAHALGFTRITARGFDVAEEQIEAAKRMAQPLAKLDGVELTFEVGDLTAPLPEADASIDLSLCLYSVLSHLPVAKLPAVAAEIARVTGGDFVTTARAVGSMPTIFVDSIEKARQFQLDHGRDQCMIELDDGRRFTVGFHLFGAAELRSCFSDWFVIEDLRGLDLFHSRFAPDSRWNPASTPIDDASRADLARLEETYSQNPWFMEHATHLLLVGRRRRSA
ncbi:MAG TPA: class I SAM-dependent methyltransferase [Aliidongia sp.]|nr:class I SAM-dependent methyltransferase [Aliidongia sp.]